MATGALILAGLGSAAGAAAPFATGNPDTPKTKDSLLSGASDIRADPLFGALTKESLTQLGIDPSLSLASPFNLIGSGYEGIRQQEIIRLNDQSIPRAQRAIKDGIEAGDDIKTIEKRIVQATDVYYRNTPLDQIPDNAWLESRTPELGILRLTISQSGINGIEDFIKRELDFREGATPEQIAQVEQRQQQRQRIIQDYTDRASAPLPDAPSFTPDMFAPEGGFAKFPGINAGSQGAQGQQQIPPGLQPLMQMLQQNPQLDQQFAAALQGNPGLLQQIIQQGGAGQLPTDPQAVGNARDFIGDLQGRGGQTRPQLHRKSAPTAISPGPQQPPNFALPGVVGPELIGGQVTSLADFQTLQGEVRNRIINDINFEANRAIESTLQMANSRGMNPAATIGEIQREAQRSIRNSDLQALEQTSALLQGQGESVLAQNTGTASGFLPFGAQADVATRQAGAQAAQLLPAEALANLDILLNEAEASNALPAEALGQLKILLNTAAASNELPGAAKIATAESEANLQRTRNEATFSDILPYLSEYGLADAKVGLQSNLFNLEQQGAATPLNIRNLQLSTLGGSLLPAQDFGLQLGQQSVSNINTQGNVGGAQSAAISGSALRQPGVQSPAGQGLANLGTGLMGIASLIKPGNNQGTP